MNFERSSGVLLHPTSLPGRYGIGEIGAEAVKFADVLREMGQQLWQMLPLGPTGFGDSPYQSLSTFAGNPMLLSLDLLVEEGLLSKRRLASACDFSDERVDYGEVIKYRTEILGSVCRTFNRRANAGIQRKFKQFCTANGYWLDNYALFSAIKDGHGGVPWVEWEPELVKREPAALARAMAKYGTSIRNAKILQFLFDRQWHRLWSKCRRKGIRIVGDIPIFVAHDSADVWANPELFYLDGLGNLTVQAGVPPDYFSATGQLWGNPLYRWDEHRRTNYEWWGRRMKRVFETVDIVRIDHFRGFESYWEVPADAEDAIGGRWIKGPGADLFVSLKERLGELPIIAEDLGLITPEVEALRDELGFPGMYILQFAFGKDAKAIDYLPHNHGGNSVVYTGTHDNDTTVGWFSSQPGENSTRTIEDIARERARALDYLGTDGSEIQWDMIKLAEESCANTAIVPLQDILGLGSDSRMNCPGSCSNNWAWRFSWDMLTPELKQRMLEVTKNSNR